jgi:C-terminal processing protease CtpA/Prc
MHFSVVIADGDVRVRGTAAGFIIATGKIICDEPPQGCTLISASDVMVPDGTRVGTKPGENRITRHDPTLRGFVRFFTLKQTGVEVLPSSHGLTIATLAPGKPFACGGCQVGDEILTVNGEAMRQPETLRVALRRVAARGMPANLTVRRHGRVLTVPIWIP